ncbi:MAG: response regulator [Emcibacteraceae bacterium]|nr:response regulator [Emcibacteraceae bacterium]
MNNEIQILVVEDDDVDIMGIKRAIRKMKIANPLCVANDGIEALEILRGEKKGLSIEKPTLVLLDLNMPRMGGIEFLQNIRNDDKLRSLIVFVLTTSADERDICAAYEENIAGYIVKKRTEETLFEALKMLEVYWRIIEVP